MRLVALALFVLAACVSPRLKFETPPLQSDEETCGPAHGEAQGLLLWGVIPIQQNGRFEKAYEAARKDARADRLIDVEVWETWFWFPFIGNGFWFHVAGTGVRAKR